MKRYLGKITKVHVGVIDPDHSLIGVIFWFSMCGGSMGVSSGTKYTVNRNVYFGLGPGSNNASERDRMYDIIEVLDEVLNAAKKHTLEELVGVPVKVYIDDNHSFNDFKILTEVL